MKQCLIMNETQTLEREGQKHIFKKERDSWKRLSAEIYNVLISRRAIFFGAAKCIMARNETQLQTK